MSREIILEYIIKGTVPSGKNNTTEANTRRMALYWRVSALLFNASLKFPDHSPALLLATLIEMLHHAEKYKNRAVF